MTTQLQLIHSIIIIFTLDCGASLRRAFWCRREIIAWFSAREKGLKRKVLIYFIINNSHNILCLLCVIQVKKSGSKIITEYVACMRDIGPNKNFSRNT